MRIGLIRLGQGEVPGLCPGADQFTLDELDGHLIVLPDRHLPDHPLEDLAVLGQLARQQGGIASRHGLGRDPRREGGQDEPRRLIATILKLLALRLPLLEARRENAPLPSPALDRLDEFVNDPVDLGKLAIEVLQRSRPVRVRGIDDSVVAFDETCESGRILRDRVDHVPQGAFNVVALHPAPVAAREALPA